MAISPIMGLSTYTPTSMVQPMNYSVDNDAQFSDVYNTESTKGAGSVNGAAPVQYPNATVKEVDDKASVIDPMERQKKAMEVSGQFNNIAMQFASNNTGYSMRGVGSNYGMEGSRFDAYA